MRKRDRQILLSFMVMVLSLLGSIASKFNNGEDIHQFKTDFRDWSVSANEWVNEDGDE